MNFSDVIGQADAKQRLLQMADGGQVPHAVMLCGPEGVGKLALAVALATRLLGESPMTAKLEHPDLHFTYPIIRPKGTSSQRAVVCDDFSREWRRLLLSSPYFAIENWLEEMNADNQQAIINEAESDELSRKLSLKSSQGGYKVSIIWLPERMNVTCANKLLKLLEEPPAQTLFIMVCQQPELLLETIRSRVQRINIPRVSEEEINEALITRRNIAPEMAHGLARAAGGSWLNAIKMLNADSENNEFLKLYMQLMRTAYARNVKEMKRWSETVAAMGREKQKRMLDYFLSQTRENFMYNFDLPELNYQTEAERNFSTRFARFVGEANIFGIMDQLEQAKREITQNANPKMVFFDLALQTIVLVKLNTDK